jgi:hypothetical protein
MIPHWEYNVDKEKTLQLISDLADNDRIYLIIKEHTRGDSLPQDLDDRLVSESNTEVRANVASVSLIKWSDVVVNFGSSIGIEALLQDKHHINPSYLHRNVTIFDKTNAGHKTNSNEETILIINKIHQNSLDQIPDRNKQDLYHTVVYGNNKEHNVLETYRNLIKIMAD